jgi:hypothetical protein
MRHISYNPRNIIFLIVFSLGEKIFCQKKFQFLITVNLAIYKGWVEKNRIRAIIIDQYGSIFMIYHNMCDGCMGGRSYRPTHERTDGWNYMCNSILPNHTWVTWKKELYFSYVLCGLLIICKNTLRVEQDLVRDSSAVRQLFVRLAGAVRRQSALHKGSFFHVTQVWLGNIELHM